MMVRSGPGKLGFCRALGQGYRSRGNLVVATVREDDKIQSLSCKKNEIEEGARWIPHPRTGIYYPKGSEWVMADVPNGAASFERPHWIRGEEGVDKPVSDYF